MRSRGRKNRAVARGQVLYRREKAETQTEGSPVPTEPEQRGNEGRTYCIMALPPQGQTTPVRMLPAPARQSADPLPPKKRTEKSGAKKALRLVLGLLFTAVLVTSPLWLTSERLLPTMKHLSAASAAMKLPDGDPAAGGIKEGEVVEPEPTSTTTAATVTEPTTAATTSPPETTEGLKPVREQHIGNSGTRVENIYVKNSTGYSPDFEALLNSRADCRIKLNAGYQVLIVHTHTTEGYAQREDGLYSPDYSPRTTDMTLSVVAVGEVLTQELESRGIRTLHALEVHDYPQYNGSYDRELDTIEKYLELYPSIEMVIDVHRDAITYDDGTKLKPTADIKGKKASQVMIITGCDAGGQLYFPEWQSNLTMALQIQQTAQEMYPGIMRPLNFAPYRYNMHMTPNSLLLEFGTDVNTLDEALYAADLMGDVLAEVLTGYEV